MRNIYLLMIGLSVSLTFSLRAQFAPRAHLAYVSNVEVIVPGDFDNDGDLDLIAALDNERHLYLNDGNGLFSDPLILPGNYSLGLSGELDVADLDNDGDLDIISCSAGMIWQRNEGGGVFSDPIECYSNVLGNPLYGSAMTIMDFNNDGLLDMVYGHYLEGEWLVLNPGDGTFPTNCDGAVQIGGGYTNTFAYGDLNMDGYVDRQTANSDAFNVWVEYSDGGNPPTFGSSQTVAQYMYTSVSTEKITDLNNDGYGDLIFSVSQRPRVAHAAGGSTFTVGEIGPEEVRIVDVEDVDGDGLNDLLARQFNTFIDPVPKVVYYHNLGDFEFAATEVITFPESVDPVFGDVNGDGFADLILMTPGEIIWYRYESPELSAVVRFYHDENDNGQPDAGETPLAGAAVRLETPPETYFSNVEGEVKLYLPAGDYAFDVVPPNCWALATGVPAAYSFSVDGEPADTITVGLRFEEDENSEVSGLLTSTLTRCFQEVRFDLMIDPGCRTSAGAVALVLDEDVSFVDAEQAPDLIDGQTLWWSFADIQAGLRLRYTMTLEMPDETATGEQLQFDWYAYGADCPPDPVTDAPTSPLSENLNVCATGDYRPVVLCSYDPNDKLVQPFRDEDRNLTLFDETLQFTVRFQNTGNDTAFIVVIRDNLDPNLDWETLEVIGSSHAHETVLNQNTGEVTFTFRDILLPDSTTNEPASHGFVAYRIETLDGLPESTLITNQARIYFDLNPPILTNITGNELVSSLPIVPAADFSYLQEDSVFYFTDASLNIPEAWYWDFGDGQTSTLADPTHTYAAPGVYEVCLTVENWAGLATNCQTITWMPTRVSDAASLLSFTIAPNPTRGQTMISWAEPLPPNSYWQLYNVLGAPVSAPVLVAGSRRYTLDMSSYPAGTYRFRISAPNGVLGYGTVVKK